MSVRDLRSDLHESFDNIAELLNDPPMARLGKEAVDRLILEVRAELPCENQSDTWNNCRESRNYPDEVFPRSQWCRTCEAREMLKVPV